MLDEFFERGGTPIRPISDPSSLLKPEMFRPGQPFARATNRLRGGKVEVEDIPCCGRTARVREPDNSVDGGRYLVLCVPCRRAYELRLVSDIDNCWSAVLTLEEIEFTTTRAARRSP
jgi:hypothetical protein